MSDPTEKQKNLWTFVHGEQDEDERLRMEQSLSKDEHLQEELSDARRADKALRMLMPGLAQTDDELDQDLEDEMIRAWERSQAIGNSVPDRSTNVIKPDFGTRTRPSRLPAQIAVGLAACAVIGIGFQLTMAPLVLMQSAQILPMTYRGEEFPQGHYTEEQLRTLASKLEIAIQDGYDRETSGLERLHNLFRRRTWQVQVTIREIAEGALEVRVEGNRRTDVSEPRYWSKEFESANDLVDRAESFGVTVARELSGPIQGADP